MELGHQREFRVAGPELTSCVDVAKGSLPRSNIQDVNKGSCLAEGAGDRRQCQQAHTGAEAESDPVQGHEDHRWDKNPNGSGEFPDGNKSEDFSGVKKIHQ